MNSMQTNNDNLVRNPVLPSRWVSTQDQSVLNDPSIVGLIRPFILGAENSSLNELVDRVRQLDIYFVLGVSMYRKEVIEVDGQLLTQQDLFIDTVYRNPRWFAGYVKLATTLKNGETVRLYGDEVSKVALLRTAVRLEPNHRQSYIHLASALGPNESVLVNSRPMGKKELIAIAAALSIA